MVADGPPPDHEDGTSDLLERARAGDREALNALFERHIPTLRRWASGRLPGYARDLGDTADLVQETVIDALKHLNRFEYRGEGALQAYLRQAVINRIRNELRRISRRGATESLDSAMGQQTLEQYESGLDRLNPDERQAVIARVEMGMSYDEIAALLDKPTANAARMAVVRALLRLAEEMKR
jgi:RNA polymerase sigma-70 factor (ECF subfamily)